MERRVIARAVAVVAAAAAALAGLAGLHPGAIDLRGPDPTAAVSGICAWAAWVLTAYLLAAVLASAACHVPRCPAPLRRIANASPSTVRRLVDVSVGATTVAAVALSSAPALAQSPTVTARAVASPPAAAAPLPSPDWPGLLPQRQPVQQRRSQPQPTASRPGAAPAARLVVRAGDSLWSLTAHHLGAQATSAAVAAEWPRLYAANRAAIGPDPGLLHPGQHLVLPADERTSR